MTKDRVPSPRQTAAPPAPTDRLARRAERQLPRSHVADARPDVIWVGLSVPREYEFAVRNKFRLKAGWLVTCGGCYNFVTGAYKRAPEWMQAAGLEWLFRLVKEPKRLFWRYAVTNPLAIFLLLTRTNSPSATAL